MKIITLLSFICSYQSFANNLNGHSRFLKLINENQYEQTWIEAAPQFQRAITKAQWKKSLEQVLSPLGKNINRKKINEIKKNELPGFPKGEYHILQFQSDFQNKKKRLETMTFKFVDQKWKLTGYYIKAL